MNPMTSPLFPFCTLNNGQTRRWCIGGTSLHQLGALLLQHLDVNFINNNLSSTATVAKRTIGLKRFSLFHPFNNNNTYNKGPPIYQRLIYVGYTNRKTHT